MVHIQSQVQSISISRKSGKRMPEWMKSSNRMPEWMKKEGRTQTQCLNLQGDIRKAKTQTESSLDSDVKDNKKGFSK